MVTKRKCFMYLTIITNIAAYVIFSGLVMTAIISGMIASAYAVRKEKIDGESVKCLKYVLDGYQGASDWVVNQSPEKQNDLDKWYSNMISKAYKKNGKVSNYYCVEVGVPIFLFSIIALISLILDLILVVVLRFDL